MCLFGRHSVDFGWNGAAINSIGNGNPSEVVEVTAVACAGCCRCNGGAVDADVVIEDAAHTCTSGPGFSILVGLGDVRATQHAEGWVVVGLQRCEDARLAEADGLVLDAVTLSVIALQVEGVVA